MVREATIATLEPLPGGEWLLACLTLPVKVVRALPRLEGSFSPAGYYSERVPGSVAALAHFTKTPGENKVRKVLARFGHRRLTVLRFDRLGVRFARQAGLLALSEPVARAGKNPARKVARHG